MLKQIAEILAAAANLCKVLDQCPVGAVYLIVFMLIVAEMWVMPLLLTR